MINDMGFLCGTSGKDAAFSMLKGSQFNEKKNTE